MDEQIQMEAELFPKILEERWDGEEGKKNNLCTHPCPIVPFVYLWNATIFIFLIDSHLDRTDHYFWHSSLSPRFQIVRNHNIVFQKETEVTADVFSN